MSRAAVKDRREGARLDRWRARVEASAVLDACLVACDGCGLEQVSTGHRMRSCVLCGCDVAAFVGLLLGNHLLAG